MVVETKCGEAVTLRNLSNVVWLQIRADMGPHMCEKPHILSKLRGHPLFEGQPGKLFSANIPWQISVSGLAGAGPS
jgi:hypothetical protein